MGLDTRKPVSRVYSILWADPEEGGGGGGEEQGVRTPLINHKNIGFLSNTCPDPLKNHKATKPAFNFGPLWARQQKAISMAFPLAG